MIIKKVPLAKWGNSQAVRISNDILKELDIEDKDIDFKLEVINNKMILTPERKMAESLEELFQDFEGEPLGKADKFDWGESVGRESL